MQKIWTTSNISLSYTGSVLNVIFFCSDVVDKYGMVRNTVVASEHQKRKYRTENNYDTILGSLFVCLPYVTHLYKQNL